MQTVEGRNLYWSFAYAISSIKRQSLKNTGIVLFLALNIAMPAIVFTWTETSTYIMLEEHFAENSYQLSVGLTSRGDYTVLQDLSNRDQDFLAVEAIDYYPSTVCILSNSNLPEWSFYSLMSPMPAYGIIDSRIIPVTNEMVQRIKGEFVWTGNSSLDSGEILVSERFEYHCRRAFGFNITPGMSIGIDVLLAPLRDRYDTPLPAFPFNIEHTLVQNLTIAGIYKLRTLMTLAAESFPSVFRTDPWPETMHDMESVLGLEDSMMILQDELGQDAINQISVDGYFQPVALIKGNVASLMDIGPKNIENHFRQITTLIQDQYPEFRVRGHDYLEEITTAVEVYQRGQMLTLIALPIMFLGIYLTIYTTESTLSSRKMEIKVLRSKGASYNQITSSIMWESCILAFLGFISGIVLAIMLTPVMGSTNEFFIVDLEDWVHFFNRLRITPFTLLISGVLCLYIPGLYLYHIERRIDVYEVGNPSKGEEEREIKESRFARLFGWLLIAIMIVLLIPFFVVPEGATGIFAFVSLAFLLIITSFLGSRVVQIGISFLYEKVKMFLGEKSIYVTMSLRRRRDRFIPLMIILTISLSSSVMMLMESSSFVTTINNDVVYSYGADLRLEMYTPYDYGIIDTLVQNYSIKTVTPVKSMSMMYEGHRIFLKGVIPRCYLNISTFYPDSFNGASPEEVLMALDNTTNGAIIPQYYAELYEKSVGDTITVRQAGLIPMELVIVGTMKSAPGFGYASPYEENADTISESLGMQVQQEGFMLININHIILRTWQFETDLFLADIDADSNFTDVYDKISEDFRVNLLTPHWNLLPDREVIIQGEDSIFYSRKNPIYQNVDRFTTGIQGITFVGTIICLIMAMSAISLFFGSAIRERKPEYAIFRAVGATQEQVYSMVFSEFTGLVLAALSLSAILGIVVGYSTTFMIFGISPYATIVPQTITLPFAGSISVIAIEFFALVFSCYYPAKNAGRVNMLEELRNL